MKLARVSNKPKLSDIEISYRAFLRKTWIAIPAFITFATEILSKTALVVNADGTAKNYEVGVISFVISLALLPFVLLVVAFTRCRKEICIILFGLLNWWQILLIGLIFGGVAQLSSRAVASFLGISIASANDDPSAVGTIVYFVVFVFLVVISEEVMFRLVLQTYLQKYGSAIGIVGTALIFTLFHLQFFDRLPSHYDIVGTFGLIPIHALILSIARRYSGSFLLTLTIHVVDNSLAIIGRPDVQLPGCC